MRGSLYAREGLIQGDHDMFFLTGLVIALIAVLLLPRLRVPGGVDAAQLGSMSERWLAEHRVSRPR
jgi:hypothetical protein